jgi:hypothetical protein
MYCSPHPAALHIDPPPGSGDFASMILRAGNCFTEIVANLLAQPTRKKFPPDINTESERWLNDH